MMRYSPQFHILFDKILTLYQIEITVDPQSSSIGLGLKEFAYKSFFRVVVNSIKETADLVFVFLKLLLPYLY